VLIFASAISSRNDEALKHKISPFSSSSSPRLSKLNLDYAKNINILIILFQIIITKFCPSHGRVMAMLLPSHVQVMAKSCQVMPKSAKVIAATLSPIYALCQVKWYKFYQDLCHNKFSEKVGPTTEEKNVANIFVHCCTS
jgi:hypothetical protein